VAHSAKPHGAFQNGAPASEEDVGVAAHLLKRLQAVKTAGDLPSHKMVRDLPGGGQVIAQDMGGIVKTIITKPELLPGPAETPIEEIDYGFAPLTIPMLYCGHVVEPRPVGTGKVKIKLTSMTQKRLVSYDPDKAGPAQIEYRRFAIEYHDNHAGFRPEGDTGDVFHSQYAELFPGWWSGAMREVVQVALAYGKQPKGPDDDEVPKEERDVLNVPGEYQERIEIEVGRQRLPGYKGRPPESGQISFRFDIQKTHGVSFGTDGKPWLIQVDRNGVFAMPLPVIPATTTEAFREWMEDKGDNELLHLIDRFGGVPSGEGFPETEELFEAWKKAGVIIKVCEHGGFYDDGMLTQWQSCGWAFSESGKEGFNTCYSYGEDGVKVGHAFKLKLSLGAHKKERWTLPDFGGMGLPEEEALQLSRYLGGLYRALGTGPESRAVKFKLCNSEASDILGRASGDGAADVDYWRNLECEPIAKHSGSISNVGSGKLYHSIPLVPKIKYPVPFRGRGGCIQFNFEPSKKLDKDAWKKIKCDTIMLGYYIGEQLKVVKYFYDAEEIEPEAEQGDWEGCPWYGSRTYTYTYDPSVLMGNFYTTDFDEREVTSPSEMTSIETAWPGEAGSPGMNNAPLLSCWFNIFRARNYHRMTEERGKTGYSSEIAVCVPWGNRSAGLHARSKSSIETWHSIGQFRTETLPDKYTYHAGSYLKYFRDIGLNWGKKPVEGKGDGVPFLVDEEYTNIYPWSECSGAGESWLAVGQDVTFLNPDVVNPNVITSIEKPAGEPPAGEFPDAAGEKTEGEVTYTLHYSSESVVGKVGDDFTIPYFELSPGEGGAVTKVVASGNYCGTSDYAAITEKVKTTDPNLSWGNSSLLTKGDIPRFIGVIHE